MHIFEALIEIGGEKYKRCFEFCREKEPIIYEGDLMDEEGVLDFLTSLEAMDLPDRIEEVNSKILSKIIEETDYVAVLFCKWSSFVLNEAKPKRTSSVSFYIIGKKTSELTWINRLIQQSICVYREDLQNIFFLYTDL